MTVEEAKQEIHKMDPILNEDDKAFKAAVIMLFGSMAGKFTIISLSENTRYDYSFIRDCVRNLKKEGIWKQNTVKGKSNQWKVYHSGWFDEKEGGIAFWLDVNRALGYITVKV